MQFSQRHRQLEIASKIFDSKRLNYAHLASFSIIAASGKCGKEWRWRMQWTMPMLQVKVEMETIGFQSSQRLPHFASPWFCIRLMQVISWRIHIPCFSWCLEKDRDLEQAELLACMPHSPCGARFEESKPAPRVQEACSDKLRLCMWIFDCNGLYGIYVPILCFWMFECYAMRLFICIRPQMFLLP